MKDKYGKMRIKEKLIGWFGFIISPVIFGLYHQYGWFREWLDKKK